MKALIVGYGFVGKATEYLLQKINAEISIYDPPLGFTSEVENVDYVFLCVPTPLKNKSLDTTILEEVYEQFNKKQVVIRSTIGPDQVDKFPDAIIMPEFLRERFWKEDVDNPELPLVIGFPGEVLEGFVASFNSVKNPTVLGAHGASMFKLARNATLAMRVAIANDFYEMCERYNINYNDLANLLEQDIWIGGTHWQVPGPDGKFGFGGNCFPKDLTHTSGLCYNGYNHMKTALEQNKIWRKYK